MSCRVDAWTNGWTDGGEGRSGEELPQMSPVWFLHGFDGPCRSPSCGGLRTSKRDDLVCNVTAERL